MKMEILLKTNVMVRQMIIKQKTPFRNKKRSFLFLLSRPEITIHKKHRHGRNLQLCKANTKRLFDVF